MRLDELTGLWRSARGCCLATVLIALLLILGSCAALGWGVAKLAEAAPSDGLDVMLVIDQSDSLWELGGVGTDPALLRMEGARLFATYLGVDGMASDYRLGVVYFGTEPELVAPLGSVLKAAGDRQVLIAALSQAPQPKGWTDVNAALALAYAELVDSERANPAHAKAIVLFTDGRPQTAALATPQAGAAYLDALRGWVTRFDGAGASFYTVLLGSAISDADPLTRDVYRPFWTDLAESGLAVRFYDAHDSQDLTDVYHEIAVQLNRSRSAGAVISEVVSDRLEVPVDVARDWRSATFVIHKSDPALRTALVQPDGRTVQPTDPNVQRIGAGSRYEIWSIDRPLPGPWMIRMDGKGAVAVWLDYQMLPPTATPSATATSMPTRTPTPTPTNLPTRTPTPTPTSSPAPLSIAIATPPERRQVNPRLWMAPTALLLVLAGIAIRRLQPRRPAMEGTLRLIQGPGGARAGQTWDLTGLGTASATLGRSSHCDIALEQDPQLAGKAAVIRMEARPGRQPAPVLETLSDVAHARVNGQPVGSNYSLRDGDILELGAYQLRYENLTLRRQADRWEPQHKPEVLGKPPAPEPFGWPSDAPGNRSPFTIQPLPVRSADRQPSTLDTPSKGIEP